MEATQKKSALSVNMTEGSLWKNMLLFSLPLMLTQVLEVLFNLSDVAIAGKFADYRALGAVGSTTLLVSLFTGLLIGMGSGVNVAVARGLGMGDRQRVEKTVHTSFVLCAAIGVVLCLICVLLARPMLALLHTKDELMDGAVLYLKIYALSMPAMAVYNCGNGIMSAVGDTRRPLLYLSVAGVLNVVLNLFFVIRCHMAAEGVAIASVIAQCLSALLIVLHLLRRKDACRLELRRLRVHPQEARRVLAIGIPTGLQNAIFAVANLFVQVGLNSFDAVTVSGSSAAANADTLLFNMMAAFYTGCASFVSRNWGAGKTERIVKSYLVSMCYAAGVGAVCGLLLLFFGVVCCLYYTRRYLRPVMRDIELLKEEDCGGAQMTFDELRPVSAKLRFHEQTITDLETEKQGIQQRADLFRSQNEQLRSEKQDLQGQVENMQNQVEDTQIQLDDSLMEIRRLAYLGKKELDSKDYENFLAGYARLSSKELEICDALARGLSARQCAELIGSAPSTIDTYRKRIYEKTKIHKIRHLQLCYALMQMEREQTKQE